VAEQIKAGTILPARRSPVTITTADGLNLVGELALPADRPPVATLICLHPLPTQGGMMDSHVLRKASYRLPALADLAVLRFNTRGTESERGKSDGEFGSGVTERLDVEAAVDWAAASGLPRLWLLGWSFGTELTLKWGVLPQVEGGILLSPPLRRATDADLDRWAAAGKSAVRSGPQGGRDRRGRGQALVGGGKLCPHCARNDRPCRQSGGAPSHGAGHRMGRMIRDARAVQPGG
jgi:uncharacterized protein